MLNYLNYKSAHWWSLCRSYTGIKLTFLYQFRLPCSMFKAGGAKICSTFMLLNDIYFREIRTHWQSLCHFKMFVHHRGWKICSYLKETSKCLCKLSKVKAIKNVTEYFLIQVSVTSCVKLSHHSSFSALRSSKVRQKNPQIKQHRINYITCRMHKQHVCQRPLQVITRLSSCQR